MIAVARLAILVGIAGLIPFLAATAGLFMAPASSDTILDWFYVYSAGILAFMAGIYWTISLQLEDRPYPQSPLVSMLLSQLFFVLAGLGLLLQPPYQIALYTLAYLLLYIVDARWMRPYWPAWYLRLRLLLTTVVLACQIAVGAWFYLAGAG